MNRKKLKRDTKIVIISVIALTILTMRVSYAAFFSVQSKSIVHEITTKELNGFGFNSKDVRIFLEFISYSLLPFLSSTI